MKDSNFVKEANKFIKSMKIGASVKDVYSHVSSDGRSALKILGAVKIYFGMAGDEIYVYKYRRSGKFGSGSIGMLGDSYYEIVRFGSVHPPEPSGEINVGKYNTILDTFIAVGQEIVKMRASSFVLSNDEYDGSDFEIDAAQYIDKGFKLMREIR